MITTDKIKKSKLRCWWRRRKDIYLRRV